MTISADDVKRVLDENLPNLAMSTIAMLLQTTSPNDWDDPETTINVDIVLPKKAKDMIHKTRKLLSDDLLPFLSHNGLKNVKLTDEEAVDIVYELSPIFESTVFSALVMFGLERCALDFDLGAEGIIEMLRDIGVKKAIRDR